MSHVSKKNHKRDIEISVQITITNYKSNYNQCKSQWKTALKKQVVKDKLTLGKNILSSFSIIVRVRWVLRMLLGYDD